MKPTRSTGDDVVGQRVAVARRQWMHSELDYRTPIEIETAYYAGLGPPVYTPPAP